MKFTIKKKKKKKKKLWETNLYWIYIDSVKNCWCIDVYVTKLSTKLRRRWKWTRKLKINIYVTSSSRNVWKLEEKEVAVELD